MGGGCGLDPWIRHPDYYFSNDIVSILIGQTRFRVHKFFFQRESKIFDDLFRDAAAEAPEAGSDELPFRLYNVTPEEFARFLWVWYNGDYSHRDQTKEHWVTILTLAKRWEFPKIKQLAVREIEALALAPAERISLYNKHQIEAEGLMASYVELCKSPRVTEAEGRLIEMETLIKVFQAREAALCKAIELGHESPTSASLEDDALKAIIASQFKEGLIPPSDGTSTGSGVQASDLNGERARGTRPGKPTITLNKPQVPDRTTQPVHGTPSHSTNPTQADSTGKETQEKRQADQATSGNMKKEETPADRGETEEKVAKEAEKLKQDMAKKAKEKEEKEKAEKAEKEKQEREREAKEREQKAGHNLSGRSRNSRGR